MAVAYGSITIVDIGDLGQLSVIPESNQPNTVIYDPNVATDSQYNPNWAKTNLVLTPIIYYGSNSLNANSDGVTVSWQRKLGNSEPVDVNESNGEEVSNGKLTVKENILASESQITYICKVSYNDPRIMGTASLEAQGRITFSAIKNASNVKSASIAGESVFLYNSEGTLVTGNSIKLTATLNAVDLASWSYKDSNGDWVQIRDSSDNLITSAELTINENDSYFVNDVATIRVNTKNHINGSSEPTVFDIHVITKIRDGAPGDQIVSAVLTNDNQMIPCDSNGQPISTVLDENNNLKDVQTKITIYEGSTDITASYTITTATSGVTGNWNDDDYTYVVKALTAMVGSVTFTCEPKQESEYNSTIVKKFTLTKIQPGANGTSPIIYSLESSSLVINKNIAGNYTPSSITLSAYKQEGNSEKESYSGRFKIYDSLTNGSNAIYLSEADQSGYSYSFNSNTPTSLTVELYEAGGTTNLLDSQSIIVVSDGATGSKGDAGAAGKDAISFVLGNYSDIIPCTNAGNVTSEYVTEIPYSAYKGSTKIIPTVSVSGDGNGITTNTTTSETIKLTFTQGSNLGGKDEGAITITLTAEGVSNTQTYTWAKNKQAADGQNAILFQLYAPQGNVIINGKNDVVLQTKLVNGVNEITSNITYKWYQWDGEKYEQLSDEAGNSLTVKSEKIQSYGSFKCEATYAQKTYEAYLSVYDKTDPIQLQVISTLGDKLVNSVGKGMVYVRVFQNGKEIDPMKTTSCQVLETNSPGTSGAYIYDLSGNEATLKKYQNGAWVTEQEPTTCSYSWTLTDSTGETQTKTGKAIYLDADIVKGKTIFDVTVTIN